jgi:hypothetical protein
MGWGMGRRGEKKKCKKCIRIVENNHLAVLDTSGSVAHVSLAAAIPQLSTRAFLPAGGGI